MLTHHHANTHAPPPPTRGVDRAVGATTVRWVPYARAQARPVGLALMPEVVRRACCAVRACDAPPHVTSLYARHQHANTRAPPPPTRPSRHTMVWSTTVVPLSVYWYIHSRWRALGEPASASWEVGVRYSEAEVTGAFVGGRGPGQLALLADC